MADNSNIPSSYWERVERQMPIFGEEGQLKIARTKVAIGGAGGNGTWIALFLALIGFLNLVVVDRKRFKDSNFNRCAFGRVEDKGQDKAYVVKRDLESRFPEMRVEAIVGDLREPDIWEQIGKCEWFVESVDNDETRLSINEQCIKLGIKLVSLGTGFSIPEGKLLNAGSRAVRVIPGDACLACSALGDLPSDNATASLVLPNVIAAALGVNFVIREITGYAGDEQDGVNLIMFDLLHQTLTTERMLPTPGCPTCEKLNSAK